MLCARKKELVIHIWQVLYSFASYASMIYAVRYANSNKWHGKIHLNLSYDCCLLWTYCWWKKSG